MLPDLAGASEKEIYMKGALKQVVDLLCDPAINPVEIKDLRCIHHLKKWLAVLPQYRFACKHHAIAHIEEESNRGCPPRARVESLWGSRWLFRKTPRKFGAGRRSAEKQYPRQPCRRLKKSCSAWSSFSNPRWRPPRKERSSARSGDQIAGRKNSRTNSCRRHLAPFGLRVWTKDRVSILGKSLSEFL